MIHPTERPIFMNQPYDALLIVSFGGPDRPEDVLPFLENVLRGKPVPRERMLEVAEHYYHFGGKSPINDQVRELISALKIEFQKSGIDLPIYWGNRNWHPMLTDTVREMAEQGVQRALAFFTSGYSCYSGCRQYRENIIAAREAVGAQAPLIEKTRMFYNHPLFIEANTERLRTAMSTWSGEERQQAHLTFTAHSIPMSMADRSNYTLQLTETCRLIANALEFEKDRWSLVYQSRSGRPQDPWLEPDILDHLKSLNERNIRNVAVAPVGFLSDHMEVLYDLDEEASLLAKQLGLNFVRSGTVGTHPQFIAMIRELVEERIGRRSCRQAIGHFGPSHDVCPPHCCEYPTGRPTAAANISNRDGSNGSTARPI
ncbi:Ferrochelatase [Planctopirus ephydatiae]|uniref:Ferrochelatase n=2 Tax=Planctopirus ephydatiae TaxID=2528019 RepID=A0A518GQG4_9PLAN|nr:Ferrochelatase [Planctopirus ephydatiae]